MKSPSCSIGFFASTIAVLLVAPAEARASDAPASQHADAATDSAGGARFGFADTFVYCTALPNSTGRPAAIDSVGSLSIAANTFTLLVRSAPPLTTGMFFYGTAPAQFPMGDGFLCVSPLVPGIVALQPGAGPNAAGIVRQRLNFPSLSGAGFISPGSTRYFQYLYRDETPAGFNFSDALGATFAP